MFTVIQSLPQQEMHSVSFNLVPLWSQINAGEFTSIMGTTRCGSDYAKNSVGFREGWDG